MADKEEDNQSKEEKSGEGGENQLSKPKVLFTIIGGTVLVAFAYLGNFDSPGSEPQSSSTSRLSAPTPQTQSGSSLGGTKESIKEQLNFERGRINSVKSDVETLQDQLNRTVALLAGVKSRVDKRDAAATKLDTVLSELDDSGLMSRSQVHNYVSTQIQNREDYFRKQALESQGYQDVGGGAVASGSTKITSADDDPENPPITLNPGTWIRGVAGSGLSAPLDRKMPMLIKLVPPFYIVDGEDEIDLGKWTVLGYAEGTIGPKDQARVEIAGVNLSTKINDQDFNFTAASKESLLGYVKSAKDSKPGIPGVVVRNMTESVKLSMISKGIEGGLAAAKLGVTEQTAVGGGGGYGNSGVATNITDTNKHVLYSAGLGGAEGLSKQVEELLKHNVPIVECKPGEPIYFVLTQPIKVKLKESR